MIACRSRRDLEPECIHSSYRRLRAYRALLRAPSAQTVHSRIFDAEFNLHKSKIEQVIYCETRESTHDPRQSHNNPATAAFVSGALDANAVLHVTCSSQEDV